MAVNLLGAERNADFYIARMMASPVPIISAMTSGSLFAEGSYNEERLAGDAKRSLKLILPLLPAIIIVFFLGDKLLLFGRAYSENATRLLQMLALSALPLGFNYIYFSVKRVERKTKSIVGLSAFIVVATLALSYFLLPWMGILGAGVSYLAAQVIATSIIGFRGFKTHHRREV